MYGLERWGLVPRVSIDEIRRIRDVHGEATGAARLDGEISLEEAIKQLRRLAEERGREG